MQYGIIAEHNKEKDKGKNEDRAQFDKAFSAAMRYLEQRIDSWQDPYLVGNYAIAAASSGRADHIANHARCSSNSQNFARAGETCLPSV